MSNMNDSIQHNDYSDLGSGRVSVGAVDTSVITVV